MIKSSKLFGFILVALTILLSATLALAGGGGGGEEHAAPHANWTEIMWAAINFVMISALLVYFVRKPFMAYLRGWRGGIEREMKEAQELRDKALAKLKEVEKSMAQLDAEQEAIIKEFKDIGEREKERIIAEAEVEAKRITKEAEAAIKQEVARATKQLERQIVEQAVGLALQATQQQMNRSLQEKLVQSYFEEITEEQMSS